MCIELIKINDSKNVEFEFLIFKTKTKLLQNFNETTRNFPWYLIGLLSLVPDTSASRSKLLFQLAPVDVFMLNRSRFAADFVKAVAGNRLPLQKWKEKKWTKSQIYSLTSSLFSKAVHLTFSFLKHRLTV